MPPPMKTVHEKPSKKTPPSPAGKKSEHPPMNLRPESQELCERCGAPIEEHHKERYPGTILCRECQTSVGNPHVG
jgi:hypothetical protein